MSAKTVIRSSVAERYAAALFDLASEADKTEAVEADLKTLQAAIDAAPEFAKFLRSPVYGGEDRRRAVGAVADKADLSALTKNFLGLVARNRRLFALEDMIRAFQRLLADHRGEISAEVVSAAPLNEDQMRRLRSEIESVVGKAVNLKMRADPDLLGGMIVKVGSRMIDSSLRAKLARLKSVMKEA
ncbi:MAG: F0F1 ATP synthase subunit delta [Parvularculaceae bacterium]